MNISDFLHKFFNVNNLHLNDISGVNVETLKPGDIFIGKINTTIKDEITGKKKRLNRRLDIYRVVEITSKTVETPNGTKTVPGRFTVENGSKSIFYATLSGIKSVKPSQELLDTIVQAGLADEKLQRELKFAKEIDEKGIDFDSLKTEDKVKTIVAAGTTNIWMVGPAGSGKSTIARNIADNMNVPYLCISCGIGTSSTEFIGNKFPERTPTRFSDFYAKPSIILIDEMTALDPSVAQILNAALANGEIETTTGLVKRHPQCIIIATSNTFGTGADRQYVANNQLDSSTIDRFIGGIIEVDYSAEYESQFDSEVVDYVNEIRKYIKSREIRRVASTRMIIQGHKLKYALVKQWKDILLANWSKEEITTFKATL